MSTSHPTEALYTLCPLPIASNIAVELGWLDEEFQRIGARARYLRSLPDNQGWLPHFRHSRDDLIRDGGAVPALWTRADLGDTVLVASTASQRPGQILVRAGAGIRRVAQLAGRKVGVPRSANHERIDVLNALARQTLHYSQELAGLDHEQVQVVEFEDQGDPRELQPAQRPAELWAQLREHHQTNPAVRALADGEIDALVVQAWQAPVLTYDGRFTAIEDLDRYPDWTLKNVNGPHTTVVSRRLAEEHPEVVVAFLRAAIRAGRWINANPQAAAELLPRFSVLQGVEQARRWLDGLDLVPQLSARNLAALELKKDFLRQHGYLRNDFRISDWADGRFLAQALRELDVPTTTQH
ncbi:ABC transporter substrate-binding protein [Pseudomonas aeruginosa]|uniref:ABC transporter substrate-binding protein n=1 Tax=Pseudomonas aeruginosa TaxID=287 RepID=UPI0009A3DD2A|nr:ABC transporter substrate-binding protein [Pseudomonas aeruginosa]MBX6190300.1 ABC transporter substrate-binding protein [Pseudomonas aeruginosa]MBX6716974.1 ABC transporter substrate-binding protein [Pseudomonas aeruginosa]MBX6872453.1 ABC transporter substrate-binding protein [Pseudomonas aeruginosa]QKL12972.1 ABC transporter substrate-binding protein [Pseudomonas aeruginosa]QQV96147.1 ABC transporter substrate-binding protein [Pseudomonas aeruginosa]